MTFPRDSGPSDRKFYAVICGLLSLPFHYVFWTSIFEFVRLRFSTSLTTVLVVTAMGLVAIGLSYFAFALFRSKATNRIALLPNSALYAASALLVANALFQFKTRNMLAGVESLAVSLGAFLLAKSRGSKR